MKDTKGLLILSVILIVIICLTLIIPFFKDTNIDTDNTSITSHNTPCKDNLTDTGFLEHMIPHHEVAVFMSEQLLNKTQNPIILNILRNIIRIQTYEIAMMKDAMTNNEYTITDDMSNTNTKMNKKYYSTQGDFVKPNTLEISNTYCDPSFFNITHELHEMTDTAYIKHMIPHHQVAIDMSKKILKKSKSDFIIYMAYRIIRAQQLEIVVLENLLHSPYVYKSSIL